ncbi:hypothetical protein EV368DRAFT_83832 [Lentinula lateritia]|nr:hypothetical protein EV368DRAFT_83832 [Lentinula lateritia]
MDPDTGGGMYIVGLSSNRDSDRSRMPTPAQAEKMLQCGEAQWYPDLVHPAKLTPEPRDFERITSTLS